MLWICKLLGVLFYVKAWVVKNVFFNTFHQIKDVVHITEPRKLAEKI